MTPRIRHLARILARLQDHCRAGRISLAQQLTLCAYVLAEYGGEQRWT